MMERNYSDKTKAIGIFSDLINHVSKRGWFSSGPSTDGEDDSLLYASFHVPPEDSDRIEQLLLSAAQGYGGNTMWVVKRSQGNRFMIVPVQVEERAKSTGNIGFAAKEISTENPDMGKGIALDLILLADVMYEKFTFGS